MCQLRGTHSLEECAAGARGRLPQLSWLLSRVQVGQPAPSLLPLDAIRTASAEKFAETDPLFLQVTMGASVSEQRESGFPAWRRTMQTPFLCSMATYQATRSSGSRLPGSSPRGTASVSPLSTTTCL